MKRLILVIILSVFLLSLVVSPAIAGDETVLYKQGTSTAADHGPFIRQAFDLAISAGKNGNQTFGALLVYQGKVILTAENTVNTENDIIHHAETNLMSKAKREISPEVLRQSTMYTSTQPCTLCCAAMYYVGIKRVVYGVSSKALYRLTGWRDEGLPCDEFYQHKGKKIDWIGPVFEEEGLEVFRYMPKKN
jgi:tRNA(Arg) A34 adenosine deaminase TadA